MNELKPPSEWQSWRFHWLQNKENEILPAEWLGQGKWRVFHGQLDMTAFEMAGTGYKWYAAAVPPSVGFPTLMASDRPECQHVWNYDPKSDNVICPLCKKRRILGATLTERPAKP